MALCWFSLLVILPLAVAAAGRIAAKVSDGKQSSSTRTSWYFRSEQWLADFRTFTAACQLLMEVDTAAPGYDNSPAGQVVGNAGNEAAFKSENQSQKETAVN